MPVQDSVLAGERQVGAISWLPSIGTLSFYLRPRQCGGTVLRTDRGRELLVRKVDQRRDRVQSPSEPPARTCEQRYEQHFCNGQ